MFRSNVLVPLSILFSCLPAVLVQESTVQFLLFSHFRVFNVLVPILLPTCCTCPSTFPRVFSARVAPPVTTEFIFAVLSKQIDMNRILRLEEAYISPIPGTKATLFSFPRSITDLAWI